MRSGKGGSQPAAPDPSATVAAQGAANKETAIAQARLNQVDEYTPYGSSVYEDLGEEIDGVQRFKRTTTLDPAQQAIVDQQTGMTQDLNTLASDQIGRVETALADDFTYDGMPAAPTSDSAARQQTIDSLYSQFSSRLDPRFEQEKRAMETQMANQGISLGSDAWNESMDNFNRGRNDAYTSAMNQAVASGGAEQSRIFGLQSSARERAIQEAAYLRNLPLNEASALMGAGAGVTTPSFSPTPQTAIAGVDVAGPTALQYSGQMNAYNQNAAAGNAAMGGLFGLGGSVAGGYAGSAAGSAQIAAMFSDRRVKKDIRKVGKLNNGLPVYAFKYIWGGPDQIGLMAQDVEQVNPAAVGQVNGVKTVDYAEAVNG